jgi:hypothetical protein
VLAAQITRLSDSNQARDIHVRDLRVLSMVRGGSSDFVVRVRETQRETETERDRERRNPTESMIAEGDTEHNRSSDRTRDANQASTRDTQSMYLHEGGLL